MLVNKLKNWLSNNTSCADDITADLARANYLKHQKNLDKRRKAYLKTLCRNIKDRSKVGFTSICTIDYDDAIIGISHDDRVIYDYDKMLAHLMDQEDMTDEEAADFISYNTIRSIPYAGENAPIVMFGL